MTERVVLYLDSDGQLKEVSSTDTIRGASSGGSFQGTPTLVTSTSIFSVPINQQALFTEEIDMELGAEISFSDNSVLVEVN